MLFSFFWVIGEAGYHTTLAMWSHRFEADMYPYHSVGFPIKLGAMVVKPCTYAHVIQWFRNSSLQGEGR